MNIKSKLALFKKVAGCVDLPDEMRRLLLQQLQLEIFSSHLYTQMSSWFKQVMNLDGFAKWLDHQADEEKEHADKIIKFINDRLGLVEMPGIDAPPTRWASPLEAFQHVLEHERHVTESINKLYEFSQAMSDHATHVFIQEFVTEQIDELEQSDYVVKKLMMIGDNISALMMLDEELGARD